MESELLLPQSGGGDQDHIEAISANLQQFHHRAQLEWDLRHWFKKQGFLEVTTPVILPHSSLEEHIHPLKVTLTHQAEGGHLEHREGFLRVSPELSLKKILIGLPKVFELGPCFRDLEKSDSPEHLHAFTLLEWYHTGITISELIHEFITLVQYLSQSVNVGIGGKGGRGVVYRDRRYDLALEHWNISTVTEVFRHYAGIDFTDWDSWEEITSVAQKRGFQTTSLDDAFYWLFLNEVEPHIRNGPTIIYEYPVFQASFSQKVFRPSKKKGSGLEYGLRFEAYLGGMEICNGFQELIDPTEQTRRWQTYIEKSGDSWSKDETFLRALQILQEKNQPIAGVAVGWERLLMFLLDLDNIRDIQPLA